MTGQLCPYAKGVSSLTSPLRFAGGFAAFNFTSSNERKALMAKLDTDFILLDESIVDYGFRCLMSGGDLVEFISNPVMLVMHLRAGEGFMKASSNDMVLPIGKWYDIRIENGKLLAKPEFDDEDELAVKVQKKVQKGYLNAASVCLMPLKVSDEESLKLSGQRGPTVTKWSIRESSIVDIPNCRNAFAIRTKEGKKLQLTGNGDADQPEVLDYLKNLLPQQTTKQMDKKLLAAKLGLDENTADEVVNAKLAAVLTDANKLAAVQTQIATLEARVVELNTAADTARIEGLVDGAITAKKLAAGDREKYMRLAKADFDTTKDVIDSMKAYVSLEQKLAGGTGDNSAELAELLKLSGDELYHKEGGFERLQELSPEVFKLKYKEFFRVEYKG